MQYPALGEAIRTVLRGEPLAQEVCVNSFRFAPLLDGVLLWEGEFGFIWVHENASVMEIIAERLSRNLDNLMLHAYHYTALEAGGLVIHSAAVDWQGSGILFCGLSGAGKSTQARLWKAVYGAEPINCDQPVLLPENGGFRVCGSPWSGKETCFRNVSAPARAIIFVEQSAQNRVERLRPAEAFALLYLNNTVIPLSEQTEQQYTAVVQALAQSVPVYRQYCTATDDAPKTLHAAIFASQ